MSSFNRNMFISWNYDFLKDKITPPPSPCKQSFIGITLSVLLSKLLFKYNYSLHYVKEDNPGLINIKGDN